MFTVSRVFLSWFSSDRQWLSTIVCILCIDADTYIISIENSSTFKGNCLDLGCWNPSLRTINKLGPIHGSLWSIIWTSNALTLWGPIEWSWTCSLSDENWFWFTERVTRNLSGIITTSQCSFITLLICMFAWLECRHAGQQCFKFSLPIKLGPKIDFITSNRQHVWVSLNLIFLDLEQTFHLLYGLWRDERLINRSLNVQWRVVIYLLSSSYVTQKCSLDSSSREIGQPDGSALALHKRKMFGCLYKIFIPFSSALVCLLAGLQSRGLKKREIEVECCSDVTKESWWLTF